MRDGKHCPACARDIGFWTVFTAGLPNRIRCPHCSARLSYRGIGGVVVVLVLAMAGAAAAGWYAAYAIPELHPRRQPAAAVGIMVGIWVLVELAAVRFLRQSRVLVRLGDKNPPPSEPNDSW
jgi:hypothetical protein